MNNNLYTGNATDNRAITGVGFKPDLTWIKERQSGPSHLLQDVVRGATYQVYPNATDAQINTTNQVKSFDSDGYTIGTGTWINNNSDTYVGWNWLAGGSQGSSNTDGSINTTYTSVNTTSGISISTYAGNTTSGATIGHGLGAVPNFIMIKNLNSTENWVVYHSAIADPQTKFLQLNLSSAAQTQTGIWNDTLPTSSVISLGNYGSVNESPDNYVCYAFTEKRGYSHFNYYTGNGNADGTFCYTGFRPSWILVKITEAQDQWNMYDDRRLGYNDYNNYLAANTTNGESTGNGDANAIDILSNGFKIRGNGNAMNQANYQYVFAAFGQTLVGSNDIPNNAR